MDVNVGDRVSLDGRKVGQQPRTGVVREINEGLSGTRYTVQWDDGHTSSFMPSAGVLKVERRGRGNGSGRTKASAAASRAGAASGKAKAKAKAVAASGVAKGSSRGSGNSSSRGGAAGKGTKRR